MMKLHNLQSIVCKIKSSFSCLPFLCFISSLLFARDLNILIDKVTQTPTIYFFGLKQTTLLAIEGYITFEQFSEKFSTAKEQFLKQV
jgi:hypothetical protein